MKKTKNSLSRFFVDNKRYAGYFMLLFLSAIAMGFFQTSIAKIMGEIVDYGLSLDNEAMLRRIPLLGVLLLAEFVRNLSNYFISAHSIESIFLDTRNKIFRVITEIPISILEKNLDSGDIISRVNSDMMSLCATLDNYTWFLNVYVVGVIALIMCLRLSPILTFVYIAGFPISIFILKRVSSPLGELQSEKLKNMGLATNLATDTIRGLSVVKSYSLENIMIERYGKLVDKGTESDIASEKIGLKMNFVKNFFNIVPLFSVLMLSVYLVFKKMISPGEIIAFLSISGYIRTALELSDKTIYSFKTGNSLAERLYEILDFPLEYTGSKFIMQGEDTAVCFKNINFSYNGQENLFTNLCFDIKKGERVAIVGHSGSGKSTIIKLLCKFYQVDEGEIYVFGNKISNLNAHSLWKNVTLVDQNAFLFDDSIYNNIIYGRKDADIEEVEQVLKEAYCWDFVSDLPKGIHTKIGEDGINLSGGQRQRLAIARALIKDVPLVLLDEPTSALDVEAEAVVQKAIDNLVKGNTSLIIAHRISTIKNADRIIVIDDGKIVEQGDYDTLIDQKGYFYRLAAKQIQ